MYINVISFLMYIFKDLLNICLYINLTRLNLENGERTGNDHKLGPEIRLPQVLLRNMSTCSPLGYWRRPNSKHVNLFMH